MLSNVKCTRCDLSVNNTFDNMHNILQNRALLDPQSSRWLRVTPRGLAIIRPYLTILRGYGRKVAEIILYQLDAPHYLIRVLFKHFLLLWLYTMSNNQSDQSMMASDAKSMGVWADIKQYRRAYLLTAVASFGGMLFGWDTVCSPRS